MYRSNSLSMLVTIMLGAAYLSLMGGLITVQLRKELE